MLVWIRIAAFCGNTKVAGLNQQNQCSHSELLQPLGEQFPDGGLLPSKSWSKP